MGTNLARHDHDDDQDGSNSRLGLPIRPSVLVLAVAILGILPYVPALGGQWILDDQLLIAGNAQVHSMRHVVWWLTHDMWGGIELAGLSTDRLSYWRPLVVASYALDWSASGGNPTWFHITNLLAHAIATALVFLALRRWGLLASAAALASVLFAWHPTKAESVAWIAGRTDVFVTIGLFVACLGLARRLRGASTGIWLEAFGLLIAFLSKEQVVVLPLFAFVEVWAFLGRPPLHASLLSPRSPEGRLMLRELAGHAALVGSYMLVRALTLPMRTFAVTGLPFERHVGFVFEAFGRYLSLALWPGDLSISRALIESDSGGAFVQVPYAISGVVGVSTLLGLAWLLRVRNPAATIGVLLFLLNLVPVVNVVWAGFNTLVSPRFLYLPMIGAAFAVGAVAQHALPGGARRMVGSLACAAAVALGLRGVLRSTQFGSEDAFWQYELENKPWAPAAKVYEIARLRKLGQFDAALRVCQEAHQLALQHTPHAADGAVFIVQAIDILARTSQDVEVRKLEALSDFVRTILSKSGTAAISAGRIELVVPATGKVAKMLARDTQLELLIGELESRLGRDESALTYVQRAVTATPRSEGPLRRALRVALAGGHFGIAWEWLDRLRDISPEPLAEQDRRLAQRVRELHHQASQQSGGMHLMLAAQKLALLRLWGRAWQMLKPHEAAITATGPEPSHTLAELAFRAGDTAAAQRVLETHFEPEQIAAMRESWTHDQSRTAGDSAAW